MMHRKLIRILGGLTLCGAGLFGLCGGAVKPCRPTMDGSVVIVPGCELDVGAMVSDALGSVLDRL